MEINELICQINELAQKQRSVGLCPIEKAEQAVLRRKYIDYIKAQLIPQLERIKIID